MQPYSTVFIAPKILPERIGRKNKLKYQNKQRATVFDS